MLGPTDPTVANPFNPPHPQRPGQLLGVSVEDVAAYINLAKEDVGLSAEEAVVQAFSLLARRVHLGRPPRAPATLLAGGLLKASRWLDGLLGRTTPSSATVHLELLRTVATARSPYKGATRPRLHRSPRYARRHVFPGISPL